MTDNNIEGAALREINGRAKKDWIGTSIQLAPETKAQLEKISTEQEVPLNSVIVHACERLLLEAAT